MQMFPFTIFHFKRMKYWMLVTHVYEVFVMHHQWKNQTFREHIIQKTHINVLLAILACNKVYFIFRRIWGFMKTYGNWPFGQLVIKRSAHNGKKILLVIQISKRHLLQADDTVIGYKTKHESHGSQSDLYPATCWDIGKTSQESKREFAKTGRETNERNTETISTKNHQHFLEPFIEISKMWARSEVWFTECKFKPQTEKTNTITVWLIYKPPIIRHPETRHASWANQNTQQWCDAQILLFWSIYTVRSFDPEENMRQWEYDSSHGLFHFTRYMERFFLVCTKRTIRIMKRFQLESYPIYSVSSYSEIVLSSYLRLDPRLFLCPSSWDKLTVKTFTHFKTKTITENCPRWLPA